MEHLSMRKFRKMMKKGEAQGTILDVRTPMEFRSGHIPGAINIPVEKISVKRPALLSDKNAKIYVYCHSGFRSREAAVRLEKLGYSDIIDLGGLIWWRGDREVSR